MSIQAIGLPLSALLPTTVGQPLIAPTAMPVDSFQISFPSPLEPVLSEVEGGEGRVRGTFPIRTLATSAAIVASNFMASAAQAYSIEDHMHTVVDPQVHLLIGGGVAVSGIYLLAAVYFKFGLLLPIRSAQKVIDFYTKALNEIPSIDPAEIKGIRTQATFDKMQTKIADVKKELAALATAVQNAKVKSRWLGFFRIVNNLRIYGVLYDKRRDEKHNLHYHVTTARSLTETLSTAIALAKEPVPAEFADQADLETLRTTDPVAYAERIDFETEIIKIRNAINRMRDLANSTTAAHLDVAESLLQEIEFTKRSDIDDAKQAALGAKEHVTTVVRLLIEDLKMTSRDLGDIA